MKRVGDTYDTDTAVGLLHDDRQDEALVNARVASDGLDSSLHVRDFLVRVIIS